MNLKGLNILSNVIKIGLIALGVIACGLIILGPNATETKQVIEEFRDGPALSFATMLTVAIIVGCIALVLLFFFTQLISSPKKTILSIIGIAVALVLYLVFTMVGTSDTNDTLRLAEDVRVSQGTINSTTAGIITVLAAIAVAIALVVWDFIKGIGKAF